MLQLVLSCLVALMAGGSDPEALFVPLGDLPGGDFISQALGISGDGQVVVGWSGIEATSADREAFRWTMSGGMVGLNPPGEPTANSIAQAASLDGSIIVGSYTSAFRWTAPSGMEFLDDIAFGELSAALGTGVSADGSVIVGTGFGFSLVAYRWTEQTGAISLGFLSKALPDSTAAAVNAAGDVVTGQSMSGPPDVEAFRWTPELGMEGLGGLTKLPGCFFYALGWGVSADGSTIVGQARTVEFEEAFRWTAEAGLESLDPEHGTRFYSAAFDVNADGSLIVGIGEGDRAMIWDEAHGMRDFQTVLLNEYGLDPGDWILVSIDAVSDSGLHFAGNGINPQGDTEAWYVRIPATPGDINIDGSVDIADLLELLAAWGPCPAPCPPECPADVDDDCTVGVLDLLVLLAMWG